MTSTRLGAKKSTVSIIKTLSELTICAGVSGEAKLKLILGTGLLAAKSVAPIQSITINKRAK